MPVMLATVSMSPLINMSNTAGIDKEKTDEPSTAKTQNAMCTVLSS